MASPPRPADFPHHLAIPTRWNDNDVYGHVNNVEYYAFFDTVINAYLIEEGGLDIHAGAGDRRLRRVALQLPRARSPSRRPSTPACASGKLGTLERPLRARAVRRRARRTPRPRAGSCTSSSTGPRAGRSRPCRARLRSSAGAAGVRIRAAVLREMGLPAPLRRVAPARGRSSSSSTPPGPGELLRPRPRGRPVPLRPVGHRRLAPARDADGAGPRGRRRGRGRRAGRRRLRRRRPRRAGVRPRVRGLRALPRRARRAVRARAPPPTPPASCWAAGAAAHPDGAPLHHHLGVSAFAEHAVVSARSAVRVDPELPFEIAALFGCAVLTGVGAVIRTRRGRARATASRSSGSAASGWPPLLGARRGRRGDDRRGRRRAREARPARASSGATHAVAAGADAVARRPRAHRRRRRPGRSRPSATQRVLAEAYAATRRGGTTVTVGLPHPSQMLVDPGREPRRRGADAARLLPRLVRARPRHPRASSRSTARAGCPSTAC